MSDDPDKDCVTLPDGSCVAEGPCMHSRENPDMRNYVGFGSQRKVQDKDGNDMMMDARYLIATDGMLRFIVRETATENPKHTAQLRILQQYQWCGEVGKFDWYDIPLVVE